MPLELGVVAHEVFDAAGHLMLLHAADVADRDTGGEHRVFADALEVATADGRAVQVDGGREQHVCPLRARLSAEGHAHLLHQRRVERRSEGRPAREGC